MNIDGCRIGTKVRFNDGAGNKPGGNALMTSKKGMPQDFKGTPCVGRFPANIILDEVAGELLDAQSGISVSKKSMRGVGLTGSKVYGSGDLSFDTMRGHNDSGGASRFFYCAKASRFMGKSWDSTGIAYNVEMWKEVLRVLKPGGHLLALS